MKNPRPLVIYHTNESTPCADGFGAAFAAWLKFGDEAEYLPMKYGQEIPEHIDPTDRDLYILDFSFLPETMKDFFEYSPKVIWLDHHAGVFKDWGFYPNSVPEDYIDETDLNINSKHTVILDNLRSGAKIAWNYFHPSEHTPKLFLHIEDYDLWKFNFLFTKELNAALQAHAPWSFEQWKKFIEPTNAACNKLYKEGALLLKAQAVQVDDVIKSSATPCFFRINDADSTHDYQGLAANCPEHLRNEVGNKLAEMSGTYGLCWYQKPNGMIKVSLRSKKGFNVLALAKYYGGSGHSTAAGFEINNATLQDLFCPF